MKKNPYILLERVEFIVTWQCSGKCRHCSVGPALNRGKSLLDKEKAVAAFKTLAECYDITSVMTFGGEPLLYPDVTCAIHSLARACAVAERQVITNGYFSRNEKIVEKTARGLKQAGVTELLLSVDAFHQETIPLHSVRLFLEELKKAGVENCRLNPAWVGSREEKNPYNERTREIIRQLAASGIEVSEGNCIFPSGNAALYLQEYYPLPASLDLSAPCGTIPYTEPLDRVRSLSIEPNGDVAICALVIGNIYQEEIDRIIERYDPFAPGWRRALAMDGVSGLLAYAKEHGKSADISGCYSACDVCRRTVKALQEK